MKKNTIFKEEAPKLLKKAFFILCALAALMIFSCGGDEGETDVGPSYYIVGTYTYPWSSVECTLVFYPDGYYKVTGGNHDIIGASTGTWSVKGDEITIITKEHPEYPDVFTVQENGNQVTLTLKNRPSSFFIGTHLVLSGTSVTLTREETFDRILYEYLISQPGGNSTTNPIDLTIDSEIPLSGTNLEFILAVINAAGKYVNIDLSACTTISDVSDGYNDGLDKDYGFSFRFSYLESCDRIISLILPDIATGIGGQFKQFSNLTSVSSKATTISNGGVFEGCTNLTIVRLPAVTWIGQFAFDHTGTPLYIYLGPTAPTLYFGPYLGNDAPKLVIVKVPTGATGYGTIPATYSGDDKTDNWGNKFRGNTLVWVDSNITLKIEYQD